MNVLWLSEIKWDYLRTRKQQILSRFPPRDYVLFIEPVSRQLPNRFKLTHFDPVHTITVGQLRSQSSPWLARVLRRRLVREMLHIAAGAWLKHVTGKIGFHPDIIAVSNIYWAENLPHLKAWWPGAAIVYDCNDNPLGFPATAEFAPRYFQKLLAVADMVSVPHECYLQFIDASFHSKITVITNGVDHQHFITPPATQPLAGLPRPIILYVGAIDQWFDDQLVARLSREFSAGSVVLVGPIAPPFRARMRHLLDRGNVHYFEPVAYPLVKDYIYGADVGIIPFVKNELTASVLPNKLFEYAAAGIPTVMSNFNPQLSPLKDLGLTASSDQDFIDQLRETLNNPRPAGDLQKLTADYDWSAISSRFRLFLESAQTG